MSIVGTLFRPLFATVLIGVSHDRETCIVQVAKKRGGAVVEEQRREFKIVDGELGAEIMNYIKKIKKRYAYTYLSILSKSTEQVLVPSTKKNTFQTFGVNEKEYKGIKLPSAFVFIHKDDIQRYQNSFKKAKGLDFLFSPFILLFFKCKTFLSDKPKMFVLQEKESLTSFISTRKDILYGSFAFINPQEAATATIDLSSMESPSSSSAKSAEDLDNLDTELGDLEQDLQDFDSFDFSELESADNTVSRSSSGGNDDDSDSVSSGDNIQDLGRSTGIVQLLKASLKDFYTNTIYESDFVEEIIIFDCYGISSQAVHNIRSNLMMEISVITTDLPREIVQLSQIELDS